MSFVNFSAGGLSQPDFRPVAERGRYDPLGPVAPPAKPAPEVAVVPGAGLRTPVDTLLEVVYPGVRELLFGCVPS